MNNKSVSIILFVIGILLLLFCVYEIVNFSYSDNTVLSIAFYSLLGIVFLLLGYNKLKEDQTDSKRK